ncbi:nuclear factor 7, ovary isoform X2 [Trematomus bernacchii]|uniref:nuclear factor 7, ovary isoform X2 n=1 Tax=Trematomus bernacchii TaxID=40690 RepID=UPI00146F773B|nr:nuclear factor 7, ovary isoform X2 [Trematomus bernacchii]
MRKQTHFTSPCDGDQETRTRNNIREENNKNNFYLSGAFWIFSTRQQARMSLCGRFLSDEQFLCSICLDVFNNPSSTPCGHSFCLACINRYWDGAMVCVCPLCKKTFMKRPDLQINRTLREITDQFRSMTGGGGVGKEKGGRRGGGGGGGRGGGIPDNLYEELRKKLPRVSPKPRKTFPSETPAVSIPSSSSSSVTPSLASSVPSQSPIAAIKIPSAPHLPQPSYPRSNSRRRFTMSGAANGPNLPVCEIHHRGTMIYCRTDKVCICPECETEEHQGHDTVTLEVEWMETKDRLVVSQQEIQEMIRQRIGKIEEIRKSASELQMVVERETSGSISLLSDLVLAVKRSQAELLEVMEMSRKAAEHQADALIRQIELEVEELRRRESNLKELVQSEDHMHCVKTFPILSSPPPAKDWSGVSLTHDLGTGTVYRSLAAQMERFQEELKNIAEKGFPPLVLEPSPVRPQPTDVTLNGNTAHARLILSEDMKSVRCGDRHQMLPDNPERFDRVVCVLGRESISTGRHYWEVEVGGKTDWDLGVARQSINRKGKIEVTPSNGYWFLSLRERNKYTFRSEPSTDVQLSLYPQKIGIFVDFEKGQVSFYNVDAKIHIHTFHDSFTECIFPFFSPCTNKSGKNDGPLTITPVT